MSGLVYDVCCWCGIEAIRKVHTWPGGRLKLKVAPPTQADTIVSRERVSGFKDWLGQ